MVRYTAEKKEKKEKKKKNKLALQGERWKQRQRLEVSAMIEKTGSPLIWLPVSPLTRRCLSSAFSWRSSRNRAPASSALYSYPHRFDLGSEMSFKRESHDWSEPAV